MHEESRSVGGHSKLYAFCIRPEPLKRTKWKRNIKTRPAERAATETTTIAL
jgi:hypothetical protein